MNPKPSIRLFSTLLCGFLVSLTFAQEPMTIVTEEWPPYNYSEGGVLKGFSTELVQRIMKNLGRDYDIGVFPGVRSKKILDDGPRVMFFTMFRTPEREASYKWIGPLDVASFYFYKRKGSPLVIKSLEDAKKASSVSCRNVGLVFSFLTEVGFSNLDTSANPSGIYQKVLNGRCALAIGETPLGVSYLLRQMGAPDDALVQTPLDILEARLYIACSKDIPDAEVALWQAALDGMKKSGEFDSLYAKYRQ